MLIGQFGKELFNQSDIIYLSVVRKHRVIGQFTFSLFFVKTTESYAILLVTIIDKSCITPVSLFKSTESNVETTETYEVFRLDHHLGSTVTGMERNGPSYRIGQETSHRTRLRGPCIGAIAVLRQIFRSKKIMIQLYKFQIVSDLLIEWSSEYTLCLNLIITVMTRYSVSTAVTYHT